MQNQLERLEAVARRYCTCGWLNPLRVGKPACDVHALLADPKALNHLLYGRHMRARLLRSEWEDAAADVPTSGVRFDR